MSYLRSLNADAELLYQPVRRAKRADSLQDSCLVVIPALNEAMITEVIENVRREEFFRIRVTQLSLSNNQPTSFCFSVLFPRLAAF